MAELLKLRQVSKAYGPNKILHKISLNIQSGESVVIVGKSGCGKSTLLRVICGILTQDSGTISQAPREDEKSFYSSVSFVPQSPSLLATKTIMENVVLPLKAINKRVSISYILKLMRTLGIAELRNRYPNQISRGQQQRVALARAMVLRPNLLILDEPFASVDEMSKEKLDTELCKLKNEYGLSTLMVTHSIEEAVYVADSVYVLANKKLSEVLKIKYAHSAIREPKLKLTKEFFEFENTLRKML